MDTTAPPTAARTAFDWAPIAILAWTALYGGLRVHWALGNAPEFAPMPDDLLIFTGWGPVALCAAAALAAIALMSTDRSRTVLACSWGVVAAMAASIPVVLLDLVGGILLGLGIPLNGPSVVGRAGMLAGTVLLASLTLAYQRRLRGACTSCGRTATYTRAGQPPKWAWWAAYLAVAGCLIRIAAQIAWGFDEFVYESGLSLILFDGVFLLAGTVLPLALVHRWGRIWPRWVPALGGRGVPRWLVLGPAFVAGGGMTLYFGMGTGLLVFETVTGTAEYDPDSPYGAGFMWTALPAYLIWGAGIGAAALARFRDTRPHCRRCGA